jgi:hypothetical protein
MPSLPLEERVALLEAEVTQLKRRLQEPVASDRPWWERIAGTFAGDPAFDKAMQLGRQYREAQRSSKARS